MPMSPFGEYLMTMTLEKGKSGNSIKDFVEQFNKNMFIEEEEEYEDDDIEEEQHFDNEEDDDLYEDDDTEPAAKEEKTLYIAINVFPEDWEFYFESEMYEPNEIPEEFVLVENLYHEDAIRIKLDDLTDEKILAQSKEITGEEKMPIVEFYREKNGSISMLIGVYFKDFQECENPDLV